MKAANSSDDLPAGPGPLLGAKPRLARERPCFVVLTNTAGGELHFTSSEDLRKFARVASDRLSVSLELLQKSVDGGMVVVALEGLTDLAFQLRNAVALLTDGERIHG